MINVSLVFLEYGFCNTLFLSSLSVNLEEEVPSITDEVLPYLWG